MRVPVQIISFSCFLFSVTVVRGQEVTCELKSRFGVKKINPEGKTIFRAEESVQITCAEGFQIINTKDPFRTFTCQENGMWDHEPVCEEIRCEVPRDQNVYNPHAYFRGDRKLGAEKRYSCISGYESKTGVATCTQDGWDPNPLCAEKMCAAPIIPNAEILADRREKYSKYSRIQYHCYPGFEPDQHVEITCNPQTGWTGIQPCTEDVRCNIPPKVENALITSKPTKFYEDGSSVTYVCRSSFLMKGKSTVFCRSGSWEEAPTCKEATCSLNITDEDLKIERPPDREGPVKPGHKLIFSCNSEGLKLKGAGEITCQSDGEWSSPFPKCEEVMCVAKLTVNMTSDGHPGPEVSVRPGDRITLSCVGSGVKLEGDSKISCLSNGEWNVPFPKCIGATVENNLATA